MARTSLSKIPTNTDLFEEDFRRATKKHPISFMRTIFDVKLHISSPCEGFIRLHMIGTPYSRRRQGFASNALRWLCSLADRHKITLELLASAQDEDSPSNYELRCWYKKFGFKGRTCDWDEDMVRRPEPIQ